MYRTASGPLPDRRLYLEPWTKPYQTGYSEASILYDSVEEPRITVNRSKSGCLEAVENFGGNVVV